MSDNEMTILIAHALMCNCDYQSSRVGKINCKSKTEPNMSEYRPDYLFLARQRRF